jgi:hypothetical protein
MAAIATAIAALTLLAGCAGQGAAGGGNVSAALRPHDASRDSTGGTCRKILGSFLESMASLRRTLAGGLTYERYMGELRSVRSAYQAIPVGRIHLGCVLSAGTPSERALNLYIEAGNAWGECLTSSSCTGESVEPSLQRRWAQAARLAGSAQAAF